eukprot:g8802.t1
MVLPQAVLRSASHGPALVELKNGDSYSGTLVAVDNFMNIRLEDAVFTPRLEQKFEHMKECTIRGQFVKFIRFPDNILDRHALDGDGRPDVIVGDKEGKLHLCSSKNELQCSDNEFGGLGVGSFASPAACDWDHDGAPDLLSLLLNSLDVAQWIGLSLTSGAFRSAISSKVPNNMPDIMRVSDGRRQRDHAKERALPFQGLFMLTPQGVLNTGRGSLDTALRIGQKLTTLKLEEATATELWH